jgi:hypothetical protein
MKNSDKREEIVQAALELIAEKGFHGAPMAMIAKKSDVAVGTIYRYSRTRMYLSTPCIMNWKRRFWRPFVKNTL